MNEQLEDERMKEAKEEKKQNTIMGQDCVSFLILLKQKINIQVFFLCQSGWRLYWVFPKPKRNQQGFSNLFFLCIPMHTYTYIYLPERNMIIIEKMSHGCHITFKPRN